MKYIFPIEGINGSGKDTVMENLKVVFPDAEYYYTKPDPEKLKTLSSFTNGSKDGSLEMVKMFLNEFVDINQTILDSDKQIFFINRYYLSNLTYSIKSFYGTELLSKIDFTDVKAENLLNNEKPGKILMDFALKLCKSDLDSLGIFLDRYNYLWLDSYNLDIVKQLSETSKIIQLTLQINPETASERITSRTGKVNEVNTVNHKIEDMKVIANLYDFINEYLYGNYFTDEEKIEDNRHIELKCFKIVNQLFHKNINVDVNGKNEEEVCKAVEDIIRNEMK